MANDASKVSAKLSALNLSLDELEAELEPLFSQSLPESVVGLDKMQQAKLQVLLPYLMYDLIFIYLKTRGVDPKTHPVIVELDRVRKYFDKIKNAEDPAKRTLPVDKAAANRFIKHAIAQVKYGRPPGQDEGADDVNTARVPVKVTSKMVARAEYEKKIREEESEEEDELQVFDEAQEEDQSGASSSNESKGKGKAVEMANHNETSIGQKRRRPAASSFAGHGDDGPPDQRPSKNSKSTPTTSTPASDAEAPSTAVSDAASSAKTKKTVKKARKKARKQAA